MPNHVTSILELRGEPQRIEALRNAVQVPDYGPGSIDFEKIIPMPEHIYRGDLGTREYELYGRNNWYDWSVANWGTKWNAYGQDEPDSLQDGCCIRFLTAWGAPHPVIRKLSEDYPDIVIRNRWADEDIGSNCGERTYKGGTALEEYIPDYGRRSIDFALEVMDRTPEDYCLVLNADGTDYEYCPELEMNP